MLPATSERVPLHTAEPVNVRIARETERRVLWYSAHTDEIPARLRELEREWDVERVLEANASGFMLAGLGLGTFVDRRFYLVSAAVGGFLLLHALQGWCPPLPVLRRMGVRTQTEIDRERFALEALRGDFGELGSRDPWTRAHAAMCAAVR